MFSDGFSEGETRDINEEFPLGSNSYTEDYDYMSDSDLGDEGEPHEGGSRQNTQIDASDIPPPPSSVEAVGATNDKRSSLFPLEICRLD